MRHFKFILLVIFSLVVLPMQIIDAKPHKIPMPKTGETFVVEKCPKENLNFFAINLFRYDPGITHSINKEGRLILSWENSCDTIQIKESVAPYCFIRPTQTKFKKGDLKIRVETEGCEPFEASITKIRIPFNLVVLMKPCK